MKTVNEQKRLQARDLFFQSGKSQGEIANDVGVSDKTLYLWTREGDWHRLRSASRLMPSMILENFYAQVQELNDDIRSRPPGKRYPTLQESEIIRKMMLTIDRSKKKHTQGEYMELMQKFLEWIGPKNNELLQTVTDYADGFLKSQSVAGFHPYDIEYEEPLASLRGNACPDEIAGKQAHENTEEAEPTDPQPQIDFPIASLRGTKQSQENTEEVDLGPAVQTIKPVTFLSGSLTEQIDKPEIIGNYESHSQSHENQQENPPDTLVNTAQSVIINQPEIGNNQQKPAISPEDLKRLMDLMEKMNELNEKNFGPSREKEEGQLYSIGEKVFRMKPR